jgi:hypothetical protein
MRRGLAVVVVAGLTGAAMAPSLARASTPGFAQLDGTLRLSAGKCAQGHPTGSYLSVTFGTRAIRNSASSCEHGAVTLLAPGRGALSTSGFSPEADQAFDSDGNAVADTIASPVRFGAHTLGLVSAARNLQDAADQAPVFTAPRIYVSGTTAYADLRSLQVLYGGFAGSSCANASGYGCWLIGAERATGSYDPHTHRLTLSWFTGQSFVPSSAGTVAHLSGIFDGTARPVPQGDTVDLGTSSVAAGSPHAAAVVADLAVARRHHVTAGSGHAVRSRRARRTRHHRQSRDAATTAAIASSPVRAPAVLTYAELLVLINAVVFLTVAHRRRGLR